MDQHVYKIVEIVGSSKTSIEDAIQTGITRAAKKINPRPGDATSSARKRRRNPVAPRKGARD